MEAVKTYILSLTGFSFISSLACALLPDIPARKTVKFVCGIILSLLILSPLKSSKFEYSDIFPQTESYNLYSSDSSSIDELTQRVLADKVSEVVEECFSGYGISDVHTEVIFDGDGNILSVNINKFSEQAAKDAAAALGLPYEIIHMTE